MTKTTIKTVAAAIFRGLDSAYSDREAVRKLAADLLDAAQSRGTDADFGRGAWTGGEIRKAERDADLLSELADELEELIGKSEQTIEWPEEQRVADLDYADEDNG